MGFAFQLLDVEQYEHTWTIPEEEYGKRRDFTDECVFTVDPASAVDLDDALSCKQIGEGNVELLNNDKLLTTGLLFISELYIGGFYDYELFMQTLKLRLHKGDFLVSL